MAKHYEFVPEDTIELHGHKLTRIRALVNLPQHNIKVGDHGGYIESCLNLRDFAWVGGNACVFGNAVIRDNAQVSDSVWVYGYAVVCGNAWVYGSAIVFDHAYITDDAQVSGSAWVYNHANIAGNTHIYENTHVN